MVRLARQVHELSEDYEKLTNPIKKRENTSNAGRLVDEIAQTNIPAVIRICEDISKKSDHNDYNIDRQLWGDNQIIHEFKIYNKGVRERMNQIIDYLNGVKTILHNLRNEVNNLVYSNE